MNQRLLFLIGIVSASGAAALIGACGGDATTLDGGNDATTNDTGTGNDTGPGNDTGLPDAAQDVNPPVDGGCVGLGNFGCRACCGQQYPDAAAFFIDQERTCACTTPGDCKANNLCGNTLCNGQLPNGQCETCLRNPDAGGCTAAATAACLNDTACAPLVTCVETCTGAPDAGGG